MKSFDEFHIDLAGRSGVEVQTTCPECSHTRKKAKARCLSVNTIEGVWCCHHCGWTGSLKSGVEQTARPPKRIVKPHYERPSSVSPILADWFAARGIPDDVVARHGISLQSVYMPQIEEEALCVAFRIFAMVRP